MSCALNKLLSIRNINSLLEWFQLNGEEQKETAWDVKWDDWDGKEGDNDFAQSDADWLGKCLLSVSSMGNVAVIAHKNSMAILTASDLVEDEDKATLSVTWKGTVADIGREEITDVICLPIASQNRSSAGVPDWTCIIIGFNSGDVSVFSENGTLLISQMFEENSVVNVSCRTFTLGDFGIPLYSDLTSEFVVGYQNCVVSIDGSHFLDILRLCRKRAAKEAAGSTDLEVIPPLKYTKYSLEEQGELSSCVSGGSLISRMYDKLVLDSSVKGFTDVNAGLPEKSHLLTVGESPYFGIVEMSKEATKVYMRDVAYELASKLKDSVISMASDWLFLKKAVPQEDTQPKIEPAAPASFRSVLPDARRFGKSVALSPSRRLAAVTDSFGRVVVIDVVRCIAVRIWKGYRDAECGWQEVVDEWGGEMRRVTFLVIYAPRRGLLEVWLPQQESRIAAFNVPKQAKLLYAHHIVLGFANSLFETYNSYPVLLLNPDGSLERIYIPFHLALSNKADRLGRDKHLLKELKKYLAKADEDSVITLAKELETVYAKYQFLLMLMDAKKYSFYLIENILETFLPANQQEDTDKTHEEEDKEQPNRNESTALNYDSQELNKMMLSLKKIRQLVDFYKYLTTNSEDNVEIPVDEDETKQILAHLVRISVKDIEELPVLTSKELGESLTKKVKLEKMETSLDFHSYMDSFIIIDQKSDDSKLTGVRRQLKREKERLEKERLKRERLERNTHIPANIDSIIYAKETMSDDVKVRLVELILAKSDFDSMIELITEIDVCAIDTFAMVKILYEGWYGLKEKSIFSAKKFALVLIGLFFYYGDFPEPECKDEYEAEKADISDFWFIGLNSMLDWTDIPAAYVTTVITRGMDHSSVEFLNEVLKISTMDQKPGWADIFNAFAKHLIEERYNYTDLNEWDILGGRIVEWSVFIDKINSLSGLSSMLKKQNSDVVITIRKMIHSDSGRISELVAKYLIQTDLTVDSLISIFKHLSADEDQSTEPLDELEPALKSIYDDMVVVKKQFPISLENQCILCNICWEAGKKWCDDPKKTEYLIFMCNLFKSLENSNITLGTAILLWKFVLMNHLTSTRIHIENFGRLPHDQISSPQLEVSEDNLRIIFRQTREFLDSIIYVRQKPESTKVLSTVPDRLWNRSSSGGLADRALAAFGLLSPNRINLHMDLIFVYHFMNYPNMKQVEIRSLFTDEQYVELFEPLTGYISDQTFLTVGPTVLKNRIEFLCNSITNKITGLPDSRTGRVYNDAEDFFEEVQDLGRIWEIDLDIFRRHYIVELLYSGFDQLACEVVPRLNLLGELPEKVFAIAGLRMKYLIDTLPGPELIKLLSSTTPVITNWTRKLEPLPLRKYKISMYRTKEIMDLVGEYADTLSDHYTPGTHLWNALPSMISNGF